MGSEFKLPSFSAPEAKEAAPAKKVIISPADEIDDDEKSLNAPNLPLLAALFFRSIFRVHWLLCARLIGHHLSACSGVVIRERPPIFTSSATAGKQNRKNTSFHAGTALREKK